MTKEPVVTVAKPVPPGPHDQASRYVPSCMRASRDLSLVHRIGLDDAIDRTIAYHKAIRI
jgi:hypothetical protein